MLSRKISPLRLVCFNSSNKDTKWLEKQNQIAPNARKQKHLGGCLFKLKHSILIF